jgi:hemerythrin superfamily protein
VHHRGSEQLHGVNVDVETKMEETGDKQSTHTQENIRNVERRAELYELVRGNLSNLTQAL